MSIKTKWPLRHGSSSWTSDTFYVKIRGSKLKVVEGKCSFSAESEGVELGKPVPAEWRKSTLDLKTVNTCKAPFTRYNLLSNRLSNLFDNRLYRVTNIQPVVKPVWQPVWQPAVSCIQPVVKAVVQPGLTTGWTNSCSFNTVVKPIVKPVVKPVWQPVWQPAVSCIQTFNRLSNRFENRLDNRLDVCLHDTAGCQTGCQTGLTTGLTTGCIV